MKKYNKKGISMIVLVITIIVIVILATIIVLGITQAGVVDNAKRAKFMSDFKNVEEGVNMYSISNIDTSNPTNYKLPVENKLSLTDKQDITNKVPTLKTKIEELNPGKTIEDINLYYINENQIDVNNISNEKKEKGYIIDVATGQIYDYVGDKFEGKRWHTLDSGVVETAIQAPAETEEMWDGWIKLTLFYPNSAIEKKWRLGSEGELRVDPMLMWQDYTGAITVPLDKVKDVWIKYKIDGKEVVIPPAGKLLVDIVPDTTGTNIVQEVNVSITYDEASTVKEYRVGDSGWTTYTGPFKVTENCIIEARAKKTESIYNTDGSLLLTRDIAGSDMVYIGNIGVVETPLPAPVITRLPAVNGDEKARVQITYPASATKKIFKINYGIEEDYTSEISVKNYGTHVIAYYYDASGKKSLGASIYINDTSTGKDPEPPVPYNPLPPVKPGDPPPYDPKTDPKNTKLVAPTITRLAAVSGDEKARVKVDYPAEAVTKKYTDNYGKEQNYTGEISIKAWGTNIVAYYYDKDGNKSPSSRIAINEEPTPAEPYPPEPYEPREIVPAPDIVITPSTGLVPEVNVSVSTPASANKTYLKIGRGGEYKEYTSPVIVRDNEELYAYYVTYAGNKSIEVNARITNIQKTLGGDPASPKVKPYVYIEANPYPWPGSLGVSEVTVSIRNSDCDTIEYSEDGVIYKPYTAPFVITENKRVYARGTNANGVSTDYLDITNIGKLSPPKPITKLAVSINVDPEPLLSITRYAKAKVTIEYDAKATEKYYRIGSSGELKTYTGEFEVDKNCTIYAYAKATDAIGSTAKTIDNILNGISEPMISSTPKNGIQSSKVSISIAYDKYASVKRYSINGGSLKDYTGAFDVTENGATIYAYSENAAGQKSDATYTVQNIVPEPPVLLLDKGDYYLLKLSYPEGSAGREYKWKTEGTWGTYKEDGILLIKPQFKDKVIQNGTIIVKIEDENGKMVDFKGDYYLIDVPISELFENLFMRWDRIAPQSPQIAISPTEPAKQVTATIVYSNLLVKKQYRIVKPGETPGAWQDYTGPITVDRNNSIIYAKGMDDTEVWSAEGTYKVTNIDEVQPVIKLTADLTAAQQKVAVKVNVTDDIAVGTVKWAPGTLGESYFETAGTEIPNDSIVNITSNGYYTFYAEDRVGNKQVYTLNVSNVDLTPPVIDIAVSPENTVGLTSNVTINYGDSTVKEYKVGTSNSTWTTYSNTFTISSYTILANNWQNADGTVTIYVKGKDTAGNEVIVQKKVLSLDLDKPNVPIINSNAGYPILTSYGVILNGDTTITYDSRTDIDNYYSIDNGTTWKTYTGQFNMTSGTIIAKSVKKNTGLEVSKSQTISLPVDSMKTQAYDKNDTTYVLGNVTEQYMKVDTSMQGQNVNVLWYIYSGRITIRFLNDSKQEISNVSRTDVTSPIGAYNDTYFIPLGTKWIKYESNYPANMLYEIKTSNEPTFSAVNGYMLLAVDANKAIKEPYQMVSINYFPTCVQRLYRIGTSGNWLSYNDQPIKVDKGQTIYAKGIDMYGNETRIVASYTANVPDSMNKEVYDGNDTTYFVGVTSGQYMQVDSSMQGKKLRVLWYTYSNSVTLRFMNDARQEISSVSRTEFGSHDDTYTIPINTKWIKYESNYVANVLYEIQLANEPVLTATNGYMLLTSNLINAIRNPYQNITITYFPTSVKRLYRIGTTGDWLNYSDQPIKVTQGQTIYAKGIDQYGNETRVISSYTANVTDALTQKAYDQDNSTYILGVVTGHYMEVDTSMQGKNLNVLWYIYSGRITIRFLNDSKQEISNVSRTDATSPIGAYNDTYVIPLGTKWIKYESTYPASLIYEVSVN